MDRAYEGYETRECVTKCGFEPVVPPKSNRLKSWTYDKIICKRGNDIERHLPQMNTPQKYAFRCLKLRWQVFREIENDSDQK
jgi:hypothetical protein